MTLVVKKLNVAVLGGPGNLRIIGNCSINSMFHGANNVTRSMFKTHVKNNFQSPCHNLSLINTFQSSKRRHNYVHLD